MLLYTYLAYAQIGRGEEKGSRDLDHLLPNNLKIIYDGRCILFFQ